MDDDRLEGVVVVDGRAEGAVGKRRALWIRSPSSDPRRRAPTHITVDVRAYRRADRVVGTVHCDPEAVSYCCSGAVEHLGRDVIVVGSRDELGESGSRLLTCGYLHLRTDSVTKAIRCSDIII